LAAWHAFQEGRATRAQLRAQLDPVAERLSLVLHEGAILRGGCAGSGLL
jgi:hypothetical protein